MLQSLTAKHACPLCAPHPSAHHSLESFFATDTSTTTLIQPAVPPLIAGVIFALALGKALPEALQMGCRVAGAKCGVVGFDEVAVKMALTLASGPSGHDE